MEAKEANRIKTRYSEERKQVEKLSSLVSEIVCLHSSWSTYQIIRVNGGVKIQEEEDKKEKLEKALSESKRIIKDLDDIYNDSPTHYPAYFTYRP